jgi:hypothetical protein
MANENPERLGSDSRPRTGRHTDGNPTKDNNLIEVEP